MAAEGLVLELKRNTTTVGRVEMAGMDMRDEGEMVWDEQGTVNESSLYCPIILITVRSGVHQQRCPG